MCEYEYEYEYKYLIIPWVRVRVLVDEYEYEYENEYEYWSMIYILYGQRYCIFQSLKKESSELAEWRSGSVSALPCERPGFASRTRLR